MSVQIIGEQANELSRLQGEIDRLRGGIQHWLDVRMAGYTDKQYGKGELRALLNGATDQPTASHGHWYQGGGPCVHCGKSPADKVSEVQK